MAALRRYRRLAQILLRMEIELLFALRAAEVISLPFVLGSSSGGSRFYVHAAHRIFHGCCVFHYHSPSFVIASACPVLGDGPGTFRISGASRWPVPEKALAAMVFPVPSVGEYQWNIRFTERPRPNLNAAQGNGRPVFRFM